MKKSEVGGIEKECGKGFCLLQFFVSLHHLARTPFFGFKKTEGATDPYSSSWKSRKAIETRRRQRQRKRQR